MTTDRELDDTPEGVKRSEYQNKGRGEAIFCDLTSRIENEMIIYIVSGVKEFGIVFFSTNWLIFTAESVKRNLITSQYELPDGISNNPYAVQISHTIKT